MTTEERIVLWVGDSSSTCGECRMQVLPQEESHHTLAGYGGGDPGCGAVFTHVGYSGAYDPQGHEGLRVAKIMRPDLIPVEGRG